MSIEEEFRSTWSMVAGRTATAGRWADSLVTRHREPWRRYHTLNHVVWVLRHVRAIHEITPCDDAGVVVVAACFHDSVYDPRAVAGANECDSARLAGEALSELRWDESRATSVANLIESTATHESNGVHDRDVLIAADLAILGADPGAYSDYVRQVRAEYEFLDDERWVSGRGTVLDTWLTKPSLFPERLRQAVALVDGWEARARANISAEAAALVSGDE